MWMNKSNSGVRKQSSRNRFRFSFIELVARRLKIKKLKKQ